MAVHSFLLLLTSLIAITASVPSGRTDWPCPEHEDIAPCTCEEIGLNINLDCSNVPDEDTLRNVFKANFPFFNFNEFVIAKPTSGNRVPITALDDTIFGNITFVDVRIQHTDLATLTPTAFVKSFPTLERMTVTDSLLDSFPFDFLVECPKMKELNLARNLIEFMPNIYSDSLETLIVSNNPNLKYNDNTFHYAPSLRVIELQRINQNHIAENTFAMNSQLQILDLSYNEIMHLLPDAMIVSSPKLEHINLEENNISLVMPGAISGLNSPVYLDMTNNQLTELPGDVWESVFASVARFNVADLFVFDGNVFHCGCDLAWLVPNDQYLNVLSRGAMCYSGIDINDLDPAFINDHCQTRARMMTSSSPLA